VSTDPIIGSLTTVRESGVVYTGFTDRALHVRSEHGPVVIVPYDELLAGNVTANKITLHIGGKQIDLLGFAEETAQVINVVKGLLVYQETGLGKPPLVHPLSPSLARAPRDPRDPRFAKLSRLWGMAGVAALATTAVLTVGSLGGLESRSLSHFLGQSLGPPTLFVPPLLSVIAWSVGIRTRTFLWSLTSIAVYATVCGTSITWAPDPGPPAFGTYIPPPQYGWSIRLGDSLMIAIGNSAEIAALGIGARVLGSVLVAAVLFLPVAIVLAVIRWTYFRRR
jgi:hypothetical protein